MTPQNFLRLIEKQQPELLKLVRDDLPRIVGTKAMQHFRENFARGGFVDRDLESWEVTWRQKTLSGADGQRGPLLSRTNTMRNRIYFRASAGRATIYNNLIYAAIYMPPSITKEAISLQLRTRAYSSQKSNHPHFYNLIFRKGQAWAARMAWVGHASMQRPQAVQRVASIRAGGTAMREPSGK